MRNLLRVPDNVTVKIIDGSYWISWQCIEIELNDQGDAQTVIDMLVGESMLEQQVSELQTKIDLINTYKRAFGGEKTDILRNAIQWWNSSACVSSRAGRILSKKHGRIDELFRVKDD